MYYEVIGYVNNERHNLGWTDSKDSARADAWFMVDFRGYDRCQVINDKGEIIIEYKKGI